MRSLSGVCVVVLFTFAAGITPGCKQNPARDLCGTWRGTTKIDQEISITIRPDSTIEIETVADSVRQIRRGTYTLLDRRLRINLDTLETHVGDAVKREMKPDQDEAVLTFTGKNEIVLRKGLQAIVLERVEE